MNANELFSEYAKCSTFEDRFEFAVRNPVLISKNFVLMKKDEVEKNRRKDPDGFERLAELDVIRHGIAQAVSRYPIGCGPLEKTAELVSNGTIPLGDAVQSLVSADNAQHLTPLYSHIITFHCEHMVQRGVIERAQLWSRLLAEACMKIWPGGEVTDTLMTAISGWVQITGITLGSHPDGELLDRASRFASQIVRRLAGGNNGWRCDMLHALGALYSDPVSSITNEAGRREGQNAINALQKKMGVFAETQLQRFPMPTPEEMLVKAIDYFEQAREGRTGAALGLTLKAIVQSDLHLAKIRNQEPDRKRIIPLCQEALSLLQPGTDHHMTIVAALRVLGEKPPDDSSPGYSPELQNSPKGLLLIAQDRAVNDPKGALDVLVGARDYFAANADEAIRIDRLRSMVDLVPDALGAENLDRFPEGTSQAIEPIVRAAQTESWPSDKLCATIFRLSMRSQVDDSEELGLRLLEKTIEQSPALARYEEAIEFLRASLVMNTAVNELKAGNRVQSLQRYAFAMREFLHMRLQSKVFDLLERLADVAGNSDENMAQAVFLSVAPIQFEIERELGAPASQAIRNLWDVVIGGLDGVQNGSLLSMFMQAAKGTRFDALMRSDSVRDLVGGPELIRIKAEIAKAMGSTAPAAPTPIDDILLVSSLALQGAESGSAPANALRNLKLAFTQKVDERIFETAQRPALIRPELICQLLDDETVLLDYYFAELPEQRGVMMITAYWKEGMTGFRNLLKDMRTYVVEQPGTQVLLDSIGFRTFALRQELQHDPGSDALSEMARALLAEHFELLLGTPTWDHLEALRRDGKRHLAIVPHRATRYYPMQLLGPPGKSLADHWIVTMLPSFECLVRRSPARENAKGSAFGMSYRGTSRALPNADAETAQVAKIFGSRPLMDSECTEGSLLEALRTSRHVHLCAHGEHSAVAPLFQQVLVTPDATGDGRLCAHELFGQDLRGLEVLSLGTCDSALGRFDAGDNLSGMPAALLVAGTATIIGSLWQVADDAARLFFVTFYEELSQGESRQDAFRSAQTRVRQRFPQARDWAAFTYLGDWDRDVQLPASVEQIYIPMDR